MSFEIYKTLHCKKGLHKNKVADVKKFKKYHRIFLTLL